MKKLLLYFFILSININAQKNTKFPQFILKNPKKYDVQLTKKLNYKEIFEFKDTTKEHHTTLTNGYAKYKIIDKNKWTPYDTSKIVYKIDIIYTKYPRKRVDWITNYYELLANRLIELFSIDSSLNNKNIEFNTVLQSNCFTATATKQMYHGIVIYYKNKSELTNNELNKFKNKLPNGERYLFDQKKNLPPLLKNLKINDSISVDENKIFDIINNMNLLDDISTADVINVLERHPKWNNMVVVMDWTGSMYAYSGQAILWHSLNFKKQKISKFVFFNDGDNKKTEEKILGSTGGIYAFDSNNLEKIIEAMYIITQNGKGGDWPENNIEALLYAQNKWENTKELFLIADNRANVRDLSLLENLKIPVHVILCGKGFSYHIHYLNLAYQTGGTIHTIDQDVENFNELNEKGRMEILDKIWYLHNGRISGVETDLFANPKTE
jgi:hypothetical protein